MIFTQIKKFSLALFPPCRCNKLSIFHIRNNKQNRNLFLPATTATEKPQRYNHQCNYNKKNSAVNNDIVAESSKAMKWSPQSEDLPFEEENEGEHTVQQQPELLFSKTINTERTTNIPCTQKHCNTLDFQSGPSTPSKRKCTIGDRQIIRQQSSILEEHNISSDHIRKTPMYDHPNQHDKRKISSALNRFFQPHKIFYELEWSIPNYATVTSSKAWLQLDSQTSCGIERVRRLGFSELDVRLDDKLTSYINNTIFVDEKVEDILMEIAFYGGQSYLHDHRKDSVLDPDNGDGTYQQSNMQLSRLRRVHWWTKHYNLARVHFRRR